MNFFSKLLFSIFLVLIFSVSSCIQNARIPEDDIFERTKTTETEIVLINGMGYFPLSDVVFDYNAEYEEYIDEKTQEQKVKVFLKYGEVILIKDSDIVFVDGIKRKMNKVFFREKEEYMVPLELLLTKAYQRVSGYNTKWDRDRNVLIVNNPELEIEVVEEEDDEQNEEDRQEEEYEEDMQEEE